MELLFLFVVVFLFMLAIFDLSVGVSNDAVNFLNSAIGSRATSFKRILIVASVGVFVGASMSNGMMEIARHGIFRPEHFSFYDVTCIFMAVMVTDVILLDVFNTLGMPTSTTVSLVFELLGAAFVVSLIKIVGGDGLGLSQLLNTEKALAVILGIFLSVAIAFVFGTIVQFVARMLFTFNYRRRLKWKIGVFGGACATAIVYFLLIKGLKEFALMTPEVKMWISSHTTLILGSCMVVFTVVMQALHWMRVNVLKVVVLMGTFALSMAFAGNDLVNFIGVPLSGLASFQDFIVHGGGDARGFMMTSLNGPANTPVLFLMGAGVIMVMSLATSKKTRNVSNTEIGLSRQQDGEEMFGSSRIARRLVRTALVTAAWVGDHTPPRVKAWFGRHYNADESQLEDGAAFDLVRGSVNLVLAGVLIALGTSMKLPLSTTFVTFMVAMGSSLADRAWGRESAVFRITGVISVIGGWFITAGMAFIGAGLIVALMYFGGQWVMMIMAIATICLIIRSHSRFKLKKTGSDGDELFRRILSTVRQEDAWPLLVRYIVGSQQSFMAYAGATYGTITSAFINEDAGALRRSESSLLKEKDLLKSRRRKETLCLRRVDRRVAIEKSAWFHLGNACCMSILYNLRRINEICLEHVDNNFHSLPTDYVAEYTDICGRIDRLMVEIVGVLNGENNAEITVLRRRCDGLKDVVSDTYQSLYAHLRDGDVASLTVVYVYLNMLQETQEMLSSLRKYLRSYAKLTDTGFSGRRPDKSGVCQ